MSSTLKIKEQKLVNGLSISLVILVLLIKIVVSFITDSLSFFAELSDSIIDFIAVFITFIALKESRKEADFNHMFGHYKINSFAGLLQGLLIIGLYLLVIVKSIEKLISNSIETPRNNLWVALSLVLTLGLVFSVSWKILQIGKKYKNALIIAQGTNFRSDFYRNITVIVGLIVMNFGLPIIDVIMAILFSLKSIFEGFKIVKQCFLELTDANIISQEKIEKVKEEIRNVRGIKNLDSIKIRTTGNLLDSLVNVSLNIQDSMFSANLVRQNINKIVKSNFQDFNCNTIIEIQSEKIEDEKKNIEFLLEAVKLVGEENSKDKISNMHNITIDHFSDKILIQFHVDMDPNMNLEEAHRFVSKLEHLVELEVDEIFGEKKFSEVISHIEPREPLRIIHSHAILQTSPKNIIEKVQEMADIIEKIEKINDIRIQQEPEGIYLTILVQISGHTKIKEVHHLTEQASNILFSSIENLKRCHIHAEPSSNREINN
ncbi:cation diffusion facilitator family transporter [Promethearchaeum syntrophicum]|uniref:Cation diffusion facilitator family transporter n=1 Tax=Promethearchaeum syntrophicum TaxID=2594042 RepID=A0A5B9D5C0_9ARCH|nr:cation diffusion facilitator family transporter [Candidatus Prometheoarchaeum syntrophicum]QEE14304.1 ferrous iron efflux protein F [Candidatus Prometheoarchaeum syntrophicum]